MAGININQGTQTNVATDLVGTVNYQTIKLDVGAAGASSLFTNTLGTVQNINSGTLAVVSSLTNGSVRMTVGTLTTGTLQNLVSGTITSLTAGTVQTYGLSHADAFATVINVGTSVFGTIKPAVSGSSIFVTDLTISAGSATNVVIASGGTSTPILGTIFLNANGGGVWNFTTPLKTVSGSALTYKQSVDGPLTITAQGYVD